METKCGICGAEMQPRSCCEKCDNNHLEYLLGDKSAADLEYYKKMLELAEGALRDYMTVPNSMLGNRAVSYFNNKELLKPERE